LRGIGAICVALFHLGFTMMYGVPLLPDITKMEPLSWVLTRNDIFLIPGHASLLVFFTISGFVLRLALGHGEQQWGPMAVRFFAKRVFRLYPIVMVAVALTALYAGGVVAVQHQGTHPLTLLEFVDNLLLIKVSLNTTYWALQVEIVMVPVIFLLYVMERIWGARPILVIGWITTAFVFWPHWAVSDGLSCHCFALVLGTTVPTIGRRFVEHFSKRTLGLWLSGCVLALIFVGPFLGVFTHWSRIVEGYTAWVVVSAVAYRHDLRVLSILDIGPLRLLGRISGSFYVLHMLFGEIYFIYIATPLVPGRWLIQLPWLIGPLTLLGFLVFMTFCSWVSYKLIEAPGIELGNRFLRQIQRRPKPTMTSPRNNGTPTANRVAA
jgi:peptidoglycan/LPS O-acetylase OafA/YrhL